MEYLALIAEIETLKQQLAEAHDEVRVLKAPKQTKKPERVPCPSVTGKGQGCKKYCAPGLETCKVHSRPPKAHKTPTVPKEKPKKVVCTGVNMRGNPCKGKCLQDQTYCEKHDPSLPPKEKKVKKKKVAPEHNHGVGVEPLVPCELCETHGDMFDAGVTEVKWVDEGTFWAARNEPRMI